MTKISEILNYPIKKIKYVDICRVDLTKEMGENKYKTVEEVIEDVKKKVYHAEVYGRVISKTDKELIVLTQGDSMGIDLTLTYIPKCCVIRDTPLKSGE